MRLKPCIKKYKKDTHRAVPPEETLSRIESKMAAAGITRVADITDLDRIGIPVFSSIRPTADDGAISVYNGKGATPEEAMASAMMEGIERYSAEVHDRELVKGRFSELSSDRNALNPDELILPHPSDHDQSIQWTRGYDLVNGEERGVQHEDESVAITLHSSGRTQTVWHQETRSKRRYSTGFQR